jgi:hypothetical protein
MTSTNITQQLANNAYHHLSSRASSATLLLSRFQHDHLDGATDPFDMIIAQGLLQTGEFTGSNPNKAQTLTVD